MISKETILLIFLLLGSRLLFAQLKPVSPESVGFSSARLKNIDTMLHRYTDSSHKVAGVVAVIARNGKVVYNAAAGYSDIAKHKWMEKNAIFRLASMTKNVTVTAILMLYEEGKILLDDPVSKYIPEFLHPTVLKSFDKVDSSFTTVPAKKEITIRELLTHTSGISYPVIGSKEMKAIYAKAGIAIGLDPWQHLDERMKVLARLPLQSQPGTSFVYGLNTDVLGYLVEVVSGMSLKDFFRQRIFEPLGMNDTYFYVPPAKQSRLPKVYKTNILGRTVENNSMDTLGLNTFYARVTDGTYYCGGGGLSATVADYMKFLQMLANGGVYNGRWLLAPSTIRMMATDQINSAKVWKSPDEKYGLNVWVVTKKGSSLFPWNEDTFRWAGGWGTYFWVDPKAGIVAEIMTQHVGPAFSEMTDKFVVMAYSALVK